MTTTPRKQAERRDATRAALIAAARTLFAAQGFANTHTNEIVAAANVTRGALYHHFVDKADLFRAVVESEYAAVADAIDQTTENIDDPVVALVDGGRAFLQAMADEGRRRILLVDAPAIIDPAALVALDSAHARRTLTEGVQAAVNAGFFPQMPVDILTDLIDSMFERAASAPTTSHKAYLSALQAMFQGLRQSPR